MNRRLFGLLAAAFAVSAAACVSDPTDELSGVPDGIVTSRSRVVLSLGDSTLVTAELVDRQGATIQDRPVDITTAGGVASITDASTPPLPVTKFYVKGIAAGAGTVTVSAGSLSTTFKVLVLPPFFDGTIAVVSSGNIDTVVITAGPLIGFDTLATTVTVADAPTQPASVTPTEIKVLAQVQSATTGAPVTLEKVLFLPGTADELSVGSIDAETGVDLAGEDNEPGNDDPATGTPLALNSTIDGLLSSSDVDDFFVITLAADAAIEVTTEFAGAGSDPDIDVFILNSSGGQFCVFDNGCAMATGANPESTTTGVLPAGTYTIYVNLFDIGDAAEPAWYRLRVNTVP